jgi:Transposase, Mutator family
VILAIDGLQPDVGHEVLWILRDCLSGEVLLAKSLLSSCQDDLVALITAVKDALEVPITGVVSDGQDAIRKAVARALPEVPHQLCHFHYLREAAKPIYEADRHAKKELKKHVRGVRPIERTVEGRDDEVAQAIRGYCAAVRSSLTDDGRPPLSAPGMVLKGRLEAVVASLDRVEEQRGLPAELVRLRSLLRKGLSATASLWGPVEAAYAWVFRAAVLLANVAGRCGSAVQVRSQGLLGAMTRYRARAGSLSGALDHFRKVTRSSWSGLFLCYDVADLAPSDVGAWRKLRATLDRRQEVRAQGRRFRHDPSAYLQELEDNLIKGNLPP